MNAPMYTMPPKKADTADTVVYTWPEPSVGTYAAGATYNVLARDVGGRRTTFRVGDVALFEAENSHLPFIGLIEKLWETPDHDMLLSARWFFRPCDCPPTVPMPPDLRENEIFFSNQRDTNSVTSLIEKVRVVFEKEDFSVGPTDLPPQIRGSLTSFVCNAEYVAEKKRFRTLKPKVLTYVKCRIRQNGGTLDPIDPLDSPARGDDDAPLGTVFATEPVQLQPLSPVRPTVVIPTEGHSGDGLHLPQHSPRLVLSPSLQNRAHLEPFRRVIRVGKEFQAAVPTSIRENLRKTSHLARATDMRVMEIDTTTKLREWTADDVFKFCVAYNKHGKDFHKISREIGSISTKECVEYFYANKYRKGRKFLRDSVMLQELYGNDGFGVPIMPLSALPVREPLTSTNSSDAVASGVPLSFASIPMDTPLDSAVESTSIKPESTTDDPPVVPVSTDEGKVDAGSDGESGSELSEATNDAGNQVPAGSVSNASAKKARNGKDKNRPQRQRKTEPTWCTTCMVARSAVLACMWDKCGNTVCRTCYSQQSASYRARAVGETWRGGVLNPFWLCLACTSGKGVETGGGTPGTSGYVGLINLRDSMLITTARSVKPPTKLGSSPQIQPSHKPGKTLPSDQPLAESRKRRITAGPDAENMPAQRQKVVNPRQSTFPPDGMPFVRDAQAMLDLVSRTYARAPHVYRGFVRLLQLFHDGVLSEEDLAVHVFSLLRDAPHLLQAFKNFLSPNTQVLFMDDLA